MPRSLISAGDLDIRSEADLRSEKVGYKNQGSTASKDSVHACGRRKEMESGSVSVRDRKERRHRRYEI